MAKRKNNSYECNYHNEDGDKCTDESVSCGYCEYHNPSLVIERMMDERKTSRNHSSHSNRYSRKHSKPRTINASLADLEGRYGVTKTPARDENFSAEDEYWPQTPEEWDLFDKKYGFGAEATMFDHNTGSYFSLGSSMPVETKKKTPPRPKIEFPVGHYRIIGSADPNDKKGKFHIPHMQYFVLRTSKGYRAVWVSHCGTGVKGAPPTMALFNHHWSDAYYDFYDAESEFWRGGETPGKIKERIANVKDPKFLPPNTRKLATKGAWETLKLTGASDELIQKLKDWKDSGCPGWRTWNGEKITPYSGSAKGYTYNSGFHEGVSFVEEASVKASQDAIDAWVKKYKYKQ